MVEKFYQSFIRYLRENFISIVLSWMIVLLLFSGWINHTTPHLEGAFMLNDSNFMAWWDGLGRWALVLIKHVTCNDWFNPIYEKIIGYNLLVLSGIICGYLGYQITSDSTTTVSSKLWGFFPVFQFSAMIMVDQLFYDLQTLGIAIGFLFISIAVGFLLLFFQYRKWFFLVIAVILGIFSFGIYQSFVILFISMMSFFLCIKLVCNSSLQNKMLQRKTHMRETLMEAVVTGIVFILMYAGNSFIISFFNFNERMGYLTNQIGWKVLPFRDALETCQHTIITLLMGKGAYYSKLYMILLVLSIIALVILLIKRSIYEICLLLIYYVVFEISAFALVILSTQFMAPRTMMSYSFVAAGNIYLIMLGIKTLREYHSALIQVVRRVAAVILIVLSFMYVTNNLLKSSRLIYTDLIKCKQHEMMLADIMTRVADDGSRPIVLVGATRPKLNQACYREEHLNAGTETPIIDSHYSLVQISPDWLYQFMKVYGFECPYPSLEQIEEANVIATSMSAYPNDGCVQDCGEYIIVKLGE